MCFLFGPPSRCVAFVFLALGCCSVSCDRSVDSGKNGAEQAKLNGVVTAADQWPNPTDEECNFYASDLEDAVARGDKTAIIGAFDWDALFGKVVDSSKGMDGFKRGFVKGAKSAIGSSGGFVDQISQIGPREGSYQFLRIRTKDKRKRLLFRLLTPETGVNYHELLVARKPSGEIKTIDIYVYATAEFLSTTMRRLFLPMAADQDRSFIQKLTRQESALVTHFEEYRRMTSALRAGRYQEALRIYDTLPEALQQDKTLLILRISAAMRVNDQEYEQALNALHKYHASDPCVDLMSIDHYALKGQYDKSLACIRQLAKSIGGDPYLDALQGHTLIAMQEWAKAKERFDAAIKTDPFLIDAYWGFVSVSLRQKEFDATLRWLKQIDQQFEIEWDDLTAVDDYAEFVKSPQYRQWKALLDSK